MRAAKSVCLNVAEAAGRPSPADKARVFGIARGELLEVAAALEIAHGAAEIEPSIHARSISIADRLYALLMSSLAAADPEPAREPEPEPVRVRERERERVSRSGSGSGLRPAPGGSWGGIALHACRGGGAGW